MLNLGALLGGMGLGGGGGGMENSSIAGAQPTGLFSGGGTAGISAGGNPLAMLSAAKGLGQSSAPIMSGGVSGGGQQAPGANLAALQSNPLMAAIMQMMQSGSAGGRQVPGLGQLLRGGLMRV